MEPKEFKQIRNLIGLTQSALAYEMGVDLRTVRRWEAGEVTIPGPVELLMRTWATNEEHGMSRICFVTYSEV